MALTDKEYEAMEEKSIYPQKKIKCPRCGELLEYAEYETALKVFCPTEGCISMTLRGI